MHSQYVTARGNERHAIFLGSLDTNSKAQGEGHKAQGEQGEGQVTLCTYRYGRFR